MPVDGEQDGLEARSGEFANLTRLFQKAEDKLKLVERLHDEGLVVPSVNELRYSGYHLLRALNTTDPEERSGHIDRAERHCCRAIYDAVEVSILDRLEAIRRFEDDYRLVEVTRVLPNYVELRGRVRKAEELITTTDEDDRERYYDICEQHYSELERVAATLEDARPELNKQLRNSRRGAMVAAVSLLVALVGALAAILGAFG